MNRWRAGRAGRSIDSVLVALATLTVVLAGTGLAAGAVGAPQAQTQPQGIDSCTTIETAGTYALVGDIDATGIEDGEACISITASDVTLEGTGHTVRGTDTGTAIKADGSREHVTGVTVENVKTTDWSIGVFYLDAAGGQIENVVATNTTQGITLARATENVLAGNTVTDNAIGVAIGGESTDNVVRSTAATRNKWGIHFERQGDNNTVANNAAWNNSEWDYYSTINAGNNPVSNLRVGSATIGLESRTIGVRGIESPPASPEGQHALGQYVRVIDTREDTSLSLTMHYNGNTDGTPELWRYAGDSWARVVDPQVFPENRTVTAKIPTTGVYGLFVPGANPDANATPTVAPQSLPDADTTLDPDESVQAVTPTPDPDATTTADDANTTEPAEPTGANGTANETTGPTGTDSAIVEGTTAGANESNTSNGSSTASDSNGSAGLHETNTSQDATATNETNGTDATTRSAAGSTGTTRAPGTANTGGDTAGGSLLGPLAALATAVLAVVIAGLLTARRSRRGPRRRR